MEKPPDITEHMQTAALEYLKMGYKPIPLHPGTKAAAVKWKRLQQETPTPEDIWHWFNEGVPNIALVTGNGLVVVDVDAADEAFLGEIVEHVGETPMRSRT